MYPDLAQEWHPTRNGSLTPRDISSKSSKRIWWKCIKGHEWDSVVAWRAKGSSCPQCRRENIKTLLIANPVLSQEWHPAKNGTLTPDQVSPYFNKKVWWKCKNGHEWEAFILRRIQGPDCPYCRGKKASKDNCLKTLYPEIAKEWHPKKNNGLTPQSVTPKSNKEVWWKCRDGHEWKARIKGRVNQNKDCPICSSKKGTYKNCLATTHPGLAKEWHPTKNKDLTPNNVMAHFRYPVWWKCPHDHEWEMAVFKRTGYKKGCPICTGKVPSLDNSLSTTHPLFAQEWDSIKNELTPRDVTSDSYQVAWWKCEKGHSWRSMVIMRTKEGFGCPECSRKE